MSDSNLASVAFQREPAWSIPPVPTSMQLLRITKESLEHEKATETSSEIRPDRQRGESVQVGVDAKGGFDFEVSVGSFDGFIEAALMGAWAVDGGTGLNTVTNGVTPYSYAMEKKLLTAGNYISFNGMMVDTLALDLTSKKICTGTIAFVGQHGLVTTQSLSTRRTGLFTLAGGNIADTETITVGGKAYTGQAALTNVDGHFKVGATPDISLQNLVDAILATPSALGTTIAAAATVNADVRAQLGTVDMTMLVIELDHVAASAALATTAAHGTWDHANLSGGTGYTAAPTGLICSSSANVANILANGSVLSGCKSLNLTINNNLRGNDEIGRLDIGEVGLGECAVSGKIDAYFRTPALLLAFINHTATSLSFEISRSEGLMAGNVRGYRFTIPKLRYTKGMPVAPGKNTDVMLPLEWEAEADPVSGKTIKVEALTV